MESYLWAYQGGEERPAPPQQRPRHPSCRVVRVSEQVYGRRLRLPSRAVRGVPQVDGALLRTGGKLGKGGGLWTRGPSCVSEALQCKACQV